MMKKRIRSGGCREKDYAYRIPDAIYTLDQRHIARKGFFFVGGEFSETPTCRDYIHGQMYVEVFCPHEVRHPYPLVLLHGGGQTGLNWMMTPDGRPGWADYFLEQGYVVYVPDVPARGRSPYHRESDGELCHMSADLTYKYFAANDGNWPTAHLHTQWMTVPPVDDRGYDKHYLTLCNAQTEYLPPARQQETVRKAGAELLKLIGPAVLITHSMAGPYGWILADTCPHFVRAIVSLEPSGPPFAGVSISTGRQRPYGIADIPLEYSPQIQPPSWRRTKDQSILPPPVTDVKAWLQQEPAGKLVNLREIPVLMLTAEASYHAPFDHLTAAFLQQAGVQVKHCMLSDLGLHGNGHMMMLEKNNLEIAAVVHQWITTISEGGEEDRDGTMQ